MTKHVLETPIAYDGIMISEWQRFYPDDEASVTENNREANQ